jgi:4-hydroxy-tetrahydrodipicolinate reductase
MGQRVLHAIAQSDGIQVAGALEAPGHPSLGEDAGTKAGLSLLGVKISSDLDAVLKKADVLIDFTHHEAAMGHLRGVAARGKAMVIGTTGFDASEWEEIRRIGPTSRCVISPNMSIGVNLVWRLLGDVARALGQDYDVEILEAHHRNKVDAPSGTALRMAEILAQALGRELKEVGVFARHGQVGPRADGEIGIQTVRAGDIVGEHTVIFAGVGERIEITHRAHSRDNFARGAVRAALWVVGQPPGLYDMQDVLGVKG